MSIYAYFRIYSVFDCSSLECVIRDVAPPPSLFPFALGSVVAVLSIARATALCATFGVLPYLKPLRPARSCVLVGGVIAMQDTKNRT